VRLTDFWSRRVTVFGEGYAESVARDHVLVQLGGRTAQQALDEGEDTKVVWRAVCEALEVPATHR
jgi:hypothetical protein